MAMFNPYIFFPSYLLNMILGERKPFLAGYKITTKCNLSCTSCINYLKEEEDLHFDQIRELFKELKERGNVMLMIEGGEPFLWKDGSSTLEDVINEAKGYFHFVGITTNGTHKIETSADTVWVSIDGLEETHNMLRGREIFGEVIENIKSSAHQKIYTHTTINSVNKPEVEALVKYLSGIDTIRGMTFQFYYPYEKDNLFVEPKGREAVLDTLIRLKQEGYEIKNSFPTLNALYTNNWAKLCHKYSWMIDNVKTDGTITNGCYVRSEGYDPDCSKCGYTVYTELFNAFRLKPDAIRTGLELYFK